jgi:hypothetical protein
MFLLAISIEEKLNIPVLSTVNHTNCDRKCITSAKTIAFKGIIQ